ncbi:MAG: S1 RNA-binding domain-containing protein [Planctomycetota bacterium]
MTPKPRPEKDPIQVELEAALADASLLDIDLDTGTNAKKRREGRDEGDDLRSGTVVGVEGDDVIVELGPRMQGVLSVNEFDEPPSVGETFEFTLHGQQDGLWLLSRRRARQLAAWNRLEVGAHVEGVVKAVNSGGLEVSLGPVSAFMPASQAADHHVDDLSRLVGEKMVVEVLELEPKRKRVVVSRRKVVAGEREERRRELAGSLVVGDRVKGTVTRVEPFGAFVDIGGVEGLVHVSQLSRRRVEDAKEFVQPGQSVEAEVVKIEEGGRRIGLSMKALEPDPWREAASRFEEGGTYEGKVVRTAVRAFVELEPGVDGLVHVSQIASGERVRRVDDKLPVGKQVQVRIVSIDPSGHRISLSCLDEHGAVLGSEEAASGEEVRRAMADSVRSDKPLGTNLGDLIKKSMKNQ